MTFDQILGVLLFVALLHRYHENRFENCDKERVLLHNLYYQKFGADFAEGGAAEDEPLIEREPETPESRYNEQIERTKLELKSAARRGPAALAAAIKKAKRRGQPRFNKIRSNLDPASAKVAAEQAQRMFADVERTVANGRTTHSGG
jgi:hypothetical protein